MNWPWQYYASGGFAIAAAAVYLRPWLQSLRQRIPAPTPTPEPDDARNEQQRRYDVVKKIESVCRDLATEGILDDQNCDTITFREAHEKLSLLIIAWPPKL